MYVCVLIISSTQNNFFQTKNFYFKGTYSVILFKPETNQIYLSFGLNIGLTDTPKRTKRNIINLNLNLYT